MKTMIESFLESQAWLLHGLTGSEGGVLKLKHGRISFPTDAGRQVFDVALGEVSEIKFPWLYFGAGMTLKIGDEKHRLSFIQPGNTAGGEHANIMDARDLGDIWKLALEAD